MAFDGIVISSVADELNKEIVGGKIEKIYQPEKDELRIYIHNKGKRHQLLISANSNIPRIHLTNTKKQNPSSPPMFCMFLRKYLSGNRITKVLQPEFERIIEIYIETVTELGDTVFMKLITEIMGKHSNIILVQHDTNIIRDSIKHITVEVSRVRQVIPGLGYNYPPSQKKHNPLNLNLKDISTMFGQNIESKKLYKVISDSLTGVSPVSAREILYKTGLEDTEIYWDMLDSKQLNSLFKTIYNLFTKILNKEFTPVLVKDNTKPLEFSAIPLTHYCGVDFIYDDSISRILDAYYSAKDNFNKINAAISNLNKIINTNLDRNLKKMSIQLDTLKNTEDILKYRKYGELITANIYRIKKGETYAKVDDYYSEKQEQVLIPLDKNLSPTQNAQKYFKKYNKYKRTRNETKIQINNTRKEINYLESLLDNLEKCTELTDIEEIKQELISEGYIKTGFKQKKNRGDNEHKISSPLHFKSSDNIDIYVGKNNRQNDYLTMKLASSNDLWFHVKDMPGSHVIVKSTAKSLPSNTLQDAALLAAYFSKGKNSSNVPVDYTLRKNVRKPRGAKPGFVIYNNQQTLYVTPLKEKISRLTNL